MKIESPEVLQARLQLLVDRDIRQPTADLERGLRQLGSSLTDTRVTVSYPESMSAAEKDAAGVVFARAIAGASHAG